MGEDGETGRLGVEKMTWTGYWVRRRMSATADRRQRAVLRVPRKVDRFFFPSSRLADDSAQYCLHETSIAQRRVKNGDDQRGKRDVFYMLKREDG